MTSSFHLVLGRQDDVEFVDAPDGTTVPPRPAAGAVGSGPNAVPAAPEDAPDTDFVRLAERAEADPGVIG